MSNPPLVDSPRRSSWANRVLASITLLGVSLAAYWIGSLHGTDGIDLGLKVPEDSLDFGEVWEDKNFRWILPVQNATDSDKEIVHIATSCGCVSAEPKSLVIPARKTASITLTLDLSRGDSVESADQRDFAVEVVPIGPMNLPYSAPWQVHGKVRKALTITPPSLNFTEDLVKGTQVKSRSFVVTSRIPLKRVTATSDSPLISTAVTTGDDGTYQIAVQPNEALPAGSFRGNVSVNAVVTDGTLLPTVKVEVTGLILESVQLVPGSVMLGPRAVGDIVHESVVLLSLTPEPLVVEKIDASSANVSAESQRDPKSAGHLLRITQIIGNSGQQSESVNLVLRQGKRRMSISLPIYYFGVHKQLRTEQLPASVSKN